MLGRLVSSLLLLLHRRKKGGGGGGVDDDDDDDQHNDEELQHNMWGFDDHSGSGISTSTSTTAAAADADQMTTDISRLVIISYVAGMMTMAIIVVLRRWITKNIPDNLNFNNTNDDDDDTMTWIDPYST